MKVYRATNVSEYESLLTTKTQNEAVEGVDEYQSFRSGSQSASDEEITVGRFDVVPLIANGEYYYWFGAYDEET